MVTKINSKNEYKKLLIFILIIALILGSFIIYISIPLLGNTTIILKTTPVDPFDPLRGQFIIIEYEISNLPSIESANKGDTVYVTLEEDQEGIFRYKSASLKKPNEGIFIKGKIDFLKSENMRIIYGIEQYFFERNTEFKTNDLTAKVKLSNSGAPRIIGLLNEGKPIDI